MSADIVTLGAAKLADATSAPIVQAVRETGKDDEAEAFGEVPLMCALGVTALPAPATAAGRAEGLVTDGGSLDGVCIGAWDTRQADVAGALKPGETCLHSTGEGFDSRVFCKEGVLALVVGNDVVVTLDRAAGKIQIAGFGGIVEMKSSGITLAAPGGKSFIAINADGTLNLVGTAVTLGGASTTPVAGVTTAIIGASGMTGVPAPNVHILPA